MLTVLDVIKRTTDFFAGKGIESPRLNAELLIGHALGLKRMQLYLQFERPLSENELEQIRPLVRRRALHEPVQYILGEAEFCGVRLKLDRRALIPRPETELLVETVVAAVSDRAPERILDLGTGTGAIALALARVFPGAAVDAVERSGDALALAAENIAANDAGARVKLLASRWFENVPVDRRYNLIVSNPPYLSPTEVAQAAPEVRDFEPISALAAEEDGLADLREITLAAPRYLAPRGWLVMETGIGHHARLREIATGAGLKHTESRQDLTGRDRLFLARRE